MPDNEIRTRVVVEGADQGANNIRRYSGEVDKLGKSGANAGQMLGQLGGGFGLLGQAIGPGGMFMAAVAAAKMGLSALEDHAKRALDTLGKVTGARSANLNSIYGKGAAVAAAGQGAAYGVFGDQATGARTNLASVLGRGTRTEMAVRETYRLGRLGYDAAAAGQTMAGMMSGRNMSAEQAANLYYTSQTRMGGAGAQFLPRVMGAASMYNMDQGEALGLNELIMRQGGTAETTAQVLRGLGGASPAATKTLRKYRLQGLPLGQQLAKLKQLQNRLSPEEKAQLYGETGSQTMAGVFGQLDQFGSASGAWSGALTSEGSMAEKHYRTKFSRAEEAALVERKHQANMDMVRIRNAEEAGGRGFWSETRRFKEGVMEEGLFDEMTGENRNVGLREGSEFFRSEFRDGSYEAAKAADRQKGY